MPTKPTKPTKQQNYMDTPRPVRDRSISACGGKLSPPAWPRPAGNPDPTSPLFPPPNPTRSAMHCTHLSWHRPHSRRSRCHPLAAKWRHRMIQICARLPLPLRLLSHTHHRKHTHEPQICSHRHSRRFLSRRMCAHPAGKSAGGRQVSESRTVRSRQCPREIRWRRNVGRVRCPVGQNHRLFPSWRR